MSHFVIPHNPAIPLGLCQCGCGQTISAKRRFRQGHSSRLRTNSRGTTEERFWKRVHKTDTCWLWTGAWRNRLGYGGFYANGQFTGAHQYAYTLMCGEIPPGLYVCHDCDTPSCVRPDHLFVATQRENMHDCINKGRFKLHSDAAITPRGEEHPSAKLTTKDVMTIIALKGQLSQRIIAQQFHVTKGAISNIHSGRGWAHLQS